MQPFLKGFGQIFERFATQVAIIDHKHKRRYTYAELEDLSARLAAAIRPRIPQGGMVCLLFDNEIEIVLAYLACFHLEATAVPINATLHRNEVVGILEKVQPALLLTHAALYERYALAGTPAFTFGAAADELPLSALSEHTRQAAPFFSSLRNEFLALIMHTSGSTGVPKAIPLSSRAILESPQVLLSTPLFGTPTCVYNVVPMSYIGGIYLMLCYFASGSQVVLDEVFSPRSSYRYWPTVLEHSAETLWLTPTMASALLAIGLEEPEDRDVIARAIRRTIIFTGPIATSVKERFEATFGLHLQKSFGITETLICCHWNDDLQAPVESVGKPMPGIELAIVSDDEQRLAQGQEGEIRVRGDWVISEYWNQPDITAATFDAQGFYRTGDLGRQDEEGNLFITGRIKEIIKCGGLNVAAAEVETAILRLDGISEAAVFGIPDETYGERIIAVVSPLPGVQLRSEDVTRHCRTELTALKVPSVVLLRDKLPQNAVGKIDKKGLKQSYLAEHARGAA